MLKYAFLADVPGADPKECCKIYETGDDISLIVGTPNMENCEKLVKELAEQGFTLLDFCGAFDEEKLEVLRTGVKGVNMSRVKYLKEEQEKIDKLESFKEFGIIIEGAAELTKLSVNAASCNMHVYFIKDMDMAKTAAKKLVEEGVAFIELCGWFKEDMTRDIIAAIGSAVPVGSAGS